MKFSSRPAPRSARNCGLAAIPARLAAFFHEVTCFLSGSPAFLRFCVVFAFLAVSQSHAFAQSGGGSFDSSGLKKSFGMMGFLTMLIAYALCLLFLVLGGMAFVRKEEGYMYILGAVIMGAAPSIANYIFAANGMSNTALTADDINKAMQ